MAYNLTLADRLRKLVGKEKGVSEKNMFGGLSFLVDGKMFVGVLKDDLVVRVNPADSDKLLKRSNVRPMDFTHRPMKGFLYVSAKGYENDEDLQYWISMAMDFVSTLPQKKSKRSK